MKIPYIKIYTADLLAKSRRLNAEQIGRLVIAACEQAFEGSSQNAFLDPQEQAFYAMLNDWIAESETALKQKKLAGRKGGKATQQKNKLLDGSTACTSALSKPLASASSVCLKHTETDTETKTETEINNTKKLNKKSELTADLFEQFWQVYPKARIGNKDKARLAFLSAQKRTGITAAQIVAKAEEYARSDEVARGFAKGAQAWLNDDRFLRNYAPSDSGNNALQEARKAGMKIINEMFGGN